MDSRIFLMAELHRAQHRGAKTIEVSTAELSEVLAKLESLESKQSEQFGGQHLGYATGHKLRAMRAGARKYLTVSAYKSETFDSEVTFVDVKV